MEKHNWSLVMVAYRSFNNHSREEVEDYYYDDHYNSDEDYDVDNNTVLIPTYPFWIGTSESTAYSCGVYCIIMQCNIVV